MDVDGKIEEIRAMVRAGRGIPISASCLVNRREVLGALDELAALVPDQLGRAEELLRDRDAVIADGRSEADRLVAAGRAERARLLEETDVHREAVAAAETVRARAQEEADGLRREVDDYVDQKLAGLEIAINKTLAAIERGQDRLRGRAPAIAVGENEEIAVLRQGADDYVEVKFERFASSLRRTLDVVSRGRERLRTRSALDELASGLSAEEEAEPLPGD